MAGYKIKICYKNQVKILELPTLSISRRRFIKNSLELFEITPEVMCDDSNSFNEDSLTEENFWEFFTLFDNELNELEGDNFTIFLIFYTMAKICYLKRINDNTELVPYVDVIPEIKRETKHNINKRQLKRRLVTNYYDNESSPTEHKLRRMNAFLIVVPPLYD